MLSAKSWMPDSRTFNSNTAAARSEAIAAAPASCRSLMSLALPGRVVGGDHFDARQAAQVPVALRQGLRVRVDGLDLVDRRARQGNQAVDHPQFEVADDLQRRARAAGRSCGGWCRRWSSRSAGRRKRHCRPRRRGRRPRSWDRAGARRPGQIVAPPPRCRPPVLPGTRPPCLAMVRRRRPKVKVIFVRQSCVEFIGSRPQFESELAHLSGRRRGAQSPAV